MSEIARIPQEDQAAEAEDAVKVDVDVEVEVDAAPRRRRLPRTLKRLLLGVAAAALIAGAAWQGWQYWSVGQYMETTDDAYVQADSTTVAPRVSGYIAQVLVADNQRVHAGQVLARIDGRDLRAAADQARANVEAAQAAIANIDARRALQGSVIAQQQAAVVAAQAALTFASQDNKRYQALKASGYGTVQKAQQAAETLSRASAALARDKAALAAAQKQVEVLTTARAQAAAELGRRQAALRQARLQLSYATITAPVDGVVGARSLRVGQYVQAGTQLMAVVPLHAVYILANFKETQLDHVRKGEPVTVSVDSFPGVVLKGHVDSLSPASGLEFALLPPDNATGNFTKIVQRIPVKIVLDDDRLAGLLRPGMSVEPTIDTKAVVLAGRARADKVVAQAASGGNG